MPRTPSQSKSPPRTPTGRWSVVASEQSSPLLDNLVTDEPGVDVCEGSAPPSPQEWDGRWSDLDVAAPEKSPRPGVCNCCHEWALCACCPCRVFCAVSCTVCRCCEQRPLGTNQIYEAIRRGIRQGALTLPPSCVCCPRLFTDAPVPTWCWLFRCIQGVPGGTINTYKRIDPVGIELKLKGRWAYPSSARSPHAFLQDATPSELEKSRWIIYYHGGGFNLCKTWTYSHILRLLAARTGAYVVAPRYRRAPEHQHPAAQNDCLAAYQWLARRVPPSQITLVGDSAGGALAALVLSCLADAGAPMPAGAALISPWVDLEDFVSDSWSQARGGGKDFITARLAKRMARNYAGDPIDPSACATNRSLKGFPPLIVESGQDEVFCSQIAEYVRKLRAAGVDCVHHETENAVHVASVFFGTNAAVSTTSLSNVLEFLHNAWERKGSAKDGGATHAHDGEHVVVEIFPDESDPHGPVSEV